MIVRSAILILLINCAILISAYAQEEVGQESPGDAFNKLQELYREAAGADLRFINGHQYTESFPGTGGSPFFQSDLWYKGTLYMEGRNYADLALRYDIFRDQLIYNHILSTGNYMVVLNKTRVDSFNIDGHLFYRLDSPGQSHGEIKEGYYEVLSKGRAIFYVKWMKRLSEPTPGSAGDFSLFNEWYILNHGRFEKVNRKSGVLRSLKDHEKEIRSFIRENRIVVRPGNEGDVKRIVDHYNRLKP